MPLPDLGELKLNQVRANRGRLALYSPSRYAEGVCKLDTLLNDLMHMCDDEGVSFKEALNRASDMYYKNTSDDPKLREAFGQKQR